MKKDIGIITLFLIYIFLTAWTVYIGLLSFLHQGG